jgi:hypothetical protein
LFEIQAKHLRHYRQTREVLPQAQGLIHAAFGRSDIDNNYSQTAALGRINTIPGGGIKSNSRVIEFARCFLRLANLPNFALDRLSRYEATLWRQAGRVFFALEALDRRKPQERRRRFHFGDFGIRGTAG